MIPPLTSNKVRRVTTTTTTTTTTTQQRRGGPAATTIPAVRIGVATRESNF